MALAAYMVSSIIFFLLSIIFSHCVDVKAFAAQMEHRKLSGEKVIMAMRRNVEAGNGLEGSKIAAPPSKSGIARFRSIRPPSRPNCMANSSCVERVKNPPPPPPEVGVLPPKPAWSLNF